MPHPIHLSNPRQPSDTSLPPSPKCIIPAKITISCWTKPGFHNAMVTAADCKL